MKIMAFLINLLMTGSLIAQLPTELQFSYELQNKIAAGELRVPTSCYYYTFSGNYLEAMALYDFPISWGMDTVKVDHYKTVPALNRIIQEAKDKQIVIISESHLKPQQSIFAKQIIEALSDHGFKHLGIEALVPNMNQPDQLLDSTLNQRGYPLFNLSGYYAREPQMAQLIRTAHNNDYQLFGYERHKKIPGKDRDEIQADNIINYLEKHQSEKVIIVCGWHHAIESDLKKPGREYWMAHYLREKLGIDPLTIYQDNFTEKIINNEHEFLTGLTEKEPVLFVDQNNNIARLSEHVDIEVIHPKTQYINGRPGWLYQDESYQIYEMDQDWIDIDFPLFLMAFHPGEENGGVAVDIVELKHKYDRKKLILMPGKYTLRIDNKKEKKDREIVVE